MYVIIHSPLRKCKKIADTCKIYGVCKILMNRKNPKKDMYVCMIPDWLYVEIANRTSCVEDTSEEVFINASKYYEK